MALSSETEEVQEIDPRDVLKDLQMQETLEPLKIGDYLGETLKEKEHVSEGEDLDSEELEEEGEIWDSQTLARRSTRGQKSSREKRE